MSRENEERVPRPQEVKRQLERIQRSRRFKKAATSLKFLRLLVGSALKQRNLKEVAIGIKVFERGKDWVPLLDSIVRTGRHNLQRYLTEYYANEGCNDLIIFDVPEGTAYRVAYSYNPRSLAEKAYRAGLGKLKEMFQAGGAEISTLVGNNFVSGRLDTQADFDEALRYEPAHALALAARAEARLTRLLFWLDCPEEQLKMAGDDAAASLKLDETLRRAQMVFAVFCACCGGSEITERICGEFVQNVMHENDAYTGAFWSVMLLIAIHKEDAALEFSKARAAACPDDTVAQTAHGFVLYMMRQFDEARAQLITAESVGRSMYSRNWFAVFLRGLVALAQDDPAEALSSLDECQDKWFVEGFRILCYAKTGNGKKAGDMARALLHGSPAMYQPPLQLALANMATGDTGRTTFHWLEKALMQGDPWMMVFRLWPVFDPLRKRERSFKLLLEETKRPPWRDLESKTNG
jgi:hypothetical protein